MTVSAKRKKTMSVIHIVAFNIVKRGGKSGLVTIKQYFNTMTSFHFKRFLYCPLSALYTVHAYSANYGFIHRIDL